jgi:LysR family transcriptional activator of glutamate synthase operon
MDLHKLEAFYAIAKYENMSRAAEKLHVAQPALSRTLRTLEKELGFLLFDRLGKRLVLNSNGQLLFDHAKRILDEIKEIERELTEHRREKEKTVKLSMFAGSKFLPDLIKGFKNMHPDIHLKIMQQDIEDKILEPSDITIDSSISRIRPQCPDTDERGYMPCRSGR